MSNKLRYYLSFTLSLLMVISGLISPLASSATELVISDNGSGTDNEVTVSSQTETQVVQTNQSEITNNIDNEANSGGNEASGNSSDAAISTGDIQTETSITNDTNINTAAVGCCEESSTQAVIAGNGAGSENDININSSTSTFYSGTQTANITNTIIGSASTGNNSADYNTNGSVSIQTGDIHAAVSVNNSPVNIAQVSIASPATDITALIKGNGSDSINQINFNSVIDDSVFTNYAAEITNFIIWDLQTGNNTANGNSGGNVKIKTGDIDLNVFINNLANLGGVKIECCKEPVVPPTPDDPADPGESTHNVGGSGGSSGSILPAAAATEAGGPGINGLSDTSGDGNSIMFWLALGLITFGGKILVDELFPVKLAFKPSPRVK